MDHKAYMQIALDEAKKGMSFTSPNPMVGAVIVKDGKIISKGHHRAYGEAHAEVNAIANAQTSVEGATMYVTLEPCSHYGKTPPCSLALVQSKLKRVVVATLDPNPLVSGKGVKFLEENGIEVISGVLEDQSKELNEVFLHYISTKKPFVCLKGAMTLDGKTATKTGHSQWISSEESRNHAHMLRARYRSILVGVSTVISDDPSLTTRIDTPVKQPVRIVLDSNGRIPLASRVLNDEFAYQTWVMTTEKMSMDMERMILGKGVKVFRLRSYQDRVDMDHLMEVLAQNDIDSVLIEGGSDIHYSAFERKIVDKVVFYIAPKIIGGNQAKTLVGGVGVDDINEAFELDEMKCYSLGKDLVIEAKVSKGR
jgi:diaminohydroxyphosphoribosylaminopyrimidine deaminase/5-amino-6-(5-phosphoribosylamino)uracil reductase